MTPRLLSAGDGAVTVEFGGQISPQAAAQVAALDTALHAAHARGELPGLVETMPTFRSLTVLYDPLQTSRSEVDTALTTLLAQLARLAQSGAAAPSPPGRCWRLPVCYGGAFGVDLAGVALAAGLSPEAVAHLHAATTYRVYMIGFMPGFPFMGDLPPALHMPRRREPRLQVPAGAVAVTGGLTAVYPWQSPGGWQLIGRCPVQLFNAAAATPSLLAPGDTVGFEAISAPRLAELEAAIGAGELPPHTWLERAP